MAKKIEVIDGDVIIFEEGKVTAIKIDEENELYQQIKVETNNFTENMNQEDPMELIKQIQTDLIYQLMMSGVI
jgi:hypothetical protein